MDMEFTKDLEVTAEICDEHGFIKLSELILELVRAAMFRNRSEGGGAPRLKEIFGAVWMLRRLNMHQYQPIKVGDRLEGFGSGRTKQNTTYVMRGEYRRDGELVASMDFLTMPVAASARKKLSLDEVETLYSTQPANFVPGFDRLEMRSGLSYGIRKTITPDDCDNNGHFASQNYAQLVGNLTGLADKPGRSFRRLQLDFIKECMPGGTLDIAIQQDGSGYIVHGRHTNKKPCFNAYCEYND